MIEDKNAWKYIAIIFMVLLLICIIINVMNQQKSKQTITIPKVAGVYTPLNYSTNPLAIVVFDLRDKQQATMFVNVANSLNDKTIREVK